MTRAIINKGKPNQRIIGSIDKENKIFRKTIIGSKHIFRILNAIGIDAKYFDNMLYPNYKIMVYDEETGKLYQTTAKHFKEKGIYKHFKEEEDYRTQIFLKLEDWIMPPKTEEEKLQEFSRQVL